MGLPMLKAKQSNAMRMFCTVMSLLMFMACTDDTGCDGILPLETPLPDSAFDDEAISVVISEDGVSFLEDNILQILTTFAQTSCDELYCPPDYGMCDANNLCVSLDPTTPMVGIKVESSSFTGGELCPEGTAGFEHCNAYVLLNDIDITPTTNNADVLIDIQVDVVTTRFKISVLGSTCNMDIDPLTKNVSTTASFTNDNPLGRLEVNLGDLDFAITDADIDKIDFSGGFLGSCNIIDLIFPLFRDTVNDELTGTLQETVDEAQRDLLWESCADAECTRPDLATCTDDWCYFDEDGEPVPALLGLEGRLELETLLADLAPGAGGLIDFSLGASDGEAIGERLKLRLRGGTAVTYDNCVPLNERPQNTYPAFDAPSQTPSGDTYEVVIGISDDFLNRVMHGVYQSGALCLTIGGDFIPQLNSSAFSLLTPSLDTLVPETRPLTIQLHPRALPRLEIGRNLIETTQADPPVDHVVEPLLTLVLDDFDMDLYAPMPDALVRVMTLRLDLAVDLGLSVNGENELVLVAGDGTDWVLDAEVLNSGLLAESPEDIEDAIPVLLGIVLPLLTESLNQSFELPAASGFSVNVQEIAGIQAIGQTVRDFERYAHLSLFANLNFNAEDAMRVPDVDTQATIAATYVPTLEEFKSGEKSEIIVDVQIPGHDTSALPPVVWWRVDGGLWHFPVQGHTVRVRDLRLQVPGEHVIEVAAALPGVPSSLDTDPVSLPITIDFAAPTVTLQETATGELAIHIRDDVDAPWQLNVTIYEDFIARVAPVFDTDGNALWDMGPNAHVRVVVTDRAGHETTVDWGETFALPQTAQPVPTAQARTFVMRTDEESQAGESTALSCAHSESSTAALVWLLMCLLPAVAFRRRCLG